MFETCLPDSEVLLRRGKYQRGLVLVKKLGEKVEYRSTLDFLVALFAPVLKPAVFAYYDETGPLLVEMASKVDIARLDRAVAHNLRALERFYTDLTFGKTALPADSEVATQGWLEFVARPRCRFVVRFMKKAAA